MSGHSNYVSGLNGKQFFRQYKLRLNRFTKGAALRRAVERLARGQSTAAAAACRLGVGGTAPRGIIRSLEPPVCGHVRRCGAGAGAERSNVDLDVDQPASHPTILKMR